jgi:hypothetical protein
VRLGEFMSGNSSYIGLIQERSGYTGRPFYFRLGPVKSC